MSYFICALDKVHIGIPAERTERIIPVTRVQTTVYETNSGNDDQMGYVSLPVLFQQINSDTPHGLVLKPDAAEAAVKTVLLTPRIDVEMEIPEEKIHTLPETLTTINGQAGLLRCFSGAHFTEDSVILILNTKKLMEAIV
jgi:hypothetical protein